MKHGYIFAFCAAIFALLAAPVAAQQGKAITTSGDVMVVKTVTNESGEVETVRSIRTSLHQTISFAFELNSPTPAKSWLKISL